MRTRGAASALLLAVLVIAISAAPACKTNRRDKKPNLGYRSTTTTTRPPTTTPRRVHQIPMHNVSHTSIIIAPSKPCPPGEERDHKGRCRTRIE